MRNLETYSVQCEMPRENATIKSGSHFSSTAIIFYKSFILVPSTADVMWGLKKKEKDITALHDLITVSFFQYMKKKCVHF